MNAKTAQSGTFDRLLLSLDVTVNAIAVCDVRQGLRLIGAPDNAVSVHYVLAGTMHLTAGDTELFVGGPGSVVIVPPNVAQKITADGRPGRDVMGAENCTLGSDGLLLVDAANGQSGDLRLVCGLIMPAATGSFGILDNLKEPVIASSGDTEFFKQAYAVMLNEIVNPGLGTRALLSALMKCCLVPVLRGYFSCPKKQSELLDLYQHPRLCKAVAAIAAAPGKAHTVASLAGIACMSRSAFAKEFSARFGMAPMEFVVKERLRHAAELLRLTNLSVKQVAASVAFPAEAISAMLFGKVTERTPARFAPLEEANPAAIATAAMQCASTEEQIQISGKS